MDLLMRPACASICTSDGSGNPVSAYCSFQCAVFNAVKVVVPLNGDAKDLDERCRQI